MRLLEEMPETDFFAYSISGCTSASSSSTDCFFPTIFFSYTCNSRDKSSVSVLRLVASPTDFSIYVNALLASACLTSSNFCFSKASLLSTSTNFFASSNFSNPF